MSDVATSPPAKKNVELFPCAGGMAEGFRRAGIEFDVAVELMPDHCESYARNLGHRPMNLDARDFLRMLQMGVVKIDCRLLVADPPCTPWSHAGKRQGTTDHRDMLVDTCDIIAELLPDAYLIGNVPGLDDSKNLHIVQKYIGGLSRLGYCTADFIRLDAADYGVPQHRIRPFWFGHRIGTPCITWPEPTHGDPSVHASSQGTLAVVQQLEPWISCRQALQHLTPEELGRAVKVARKRAQNGKQHGSIAERPARVVGTSNLSDGNVIVRDTITIREGDHEMSAPDDPARTLTKNTCSGAVIVFNRKHPPASADEPSPTMGAKQRGQGGNVVMFNGKHPVADADDPANTIRGGGDGHSAPMNVLTFEPHHPPSYVDEPSITIRAGGGGGANRAMVLSGESATKKKRGGSTQGPQSARVSDPDRPSIAVQAREDRVGTGSVVLEWPWDRPSTTVTARAGLPPPGHHDESLAIMSLPDAVIISQKAATILQGFPADWYFHGGTKKAVWSQIGQAMPPPLAHAVAKSVYQQLVRGDLVEVDARDVIAQPIAELRKNVRKRKS